MTAWIEMDTLVNLRDVGGTPTTDGDLIPAGRLLRSDNLQDLTPADITRLGELGVSDVIDLRSQYEVRLEGPGPLTRETWVRIHHHSLLQEAGWGIGEDKGVDRRDLAPDEALPWVDLKPSVEAANETVATYLSYVIDRGDSVVAALRTIAEASGAALVHCAAGKDRTGTIVALALSLAGADPEAIAADYAATTERIQAILDRLMATTTYAENLRDRPLSSHLSHIETMRELLALIEHPYGGIAALLAPHGWTEADSQRLRAKLRH